MIGYINGVPYTAVFTHEDGWSWHALSERQKLQRLYILMLEEQLRQRRIEVGRLYQTCLMKMEV